MEVTRFKSAYCPIARSLDEVGEWWSLLVIREAFLGARRYQDFQERLAIAPNTLSRRLKSLCDSGLLERRRYEDHPPRDEYALTQKGHDLLPVLLCLATWGNRWLAPEGASLVPVDAKSGREVDAVLVDRKTKRELRSGEVALRAGPAAPADVKRVLSTPRVLGAA